MSAQLQAVPSVVDRIPPQNLEAEMALLGSVLLDRDVMDVVLDHVRATDFYAPLHELIFSALRGLYDRREPLDKVALGEELRRRGLLDKIGGMAYLNALMDAVPTATSAEYYAQLVHQKATLRGLIAAGAQIQRLGYEGESDVHDAVVSAERALTEVSDRGDGAVRLPEQGAVLDELVRRMVANERIRIIRSPYDGLNRTVGCFTPGELIAIVAPAKAGKTGFAVGLAEYIAEAFGPVAFFATEMGDEAIERRRIALRSRVSARRQRMGDLAESDVSLVVSAVNALRAKPLIVASKKHRTIRALWRVCRDVRTRLGQLAAIFIDHVGFLDEARDFGKHRTETQALDVTYRAMLDLADDYDCPVFVVVHPNREGSIKKPSRETLQSIRGGGALENHAHTVLCPWRSDPINNPQAAELVVVASRDGGEGSLEFFFDGPRAGWFERAGNVADGDPIPLWFERGGRTLPGAEQMALPTAYAPAYDDSGEDAVLDDEEERWGNIEASSADDEAVVG